MSKTLKVHKFLKWNQFRNILNNNTKEYGSKISVTQNKRKIAILTAIWKFSRSNLNLMCSFYIINNIIIYNIIKI